MAGNEDALAKRHARTMLWTPVVFVAMLAIAAVLWPTTDWPAWAPSVIFTITALIPAILGPRYIGVLLLLDAVLIATVPPPENDMAITAWLSRTVFIASLFLLGLWPLREHQWVLRKRDILTPWLGVLGIYLGCVTVFAWDASLVPTALGAHPMAMSVVLVGAILMLQSCGHAWVILRGPSHASLPERGFPIQYIDNPLSKDSPDRWNRSH